MGKIVDADELYAAFRRDIMGGLNYDRILREAKPVDAVPVVRCKDCKYRERYGADIIYCERHSMMTAPDCFCSDGNNEGDIVSNCYDCPMNPDSDAWMR